MVGVHVQRNPINRKPGTRDPWRIHSMISGQALLSNLDLNHQSPLRQLDLGEFPADQWCHWPQKLQSSVCPYNPWVHSAFSAPSQPGVNGKFMSTSTAHGSFAHAPACHVGLKKAIGEPSQSNIWGSLGIYHAYTCPLACKIITNPNITCAAQSSVSLLASVNSIEFQIPSVPRLPKWRRFEMVRKCRKSPWEFQIIQTFQIQNATRRTAPMVHALHSCTPKLRFGVSVRNQFVARLPWEVPNPAVHTKKLHCWGW